MVFSFHSVSVFMFTVYCLMDPCGLISNKDDNDDDNGELSGGFNLGSSWQGVQAPSFVRFPVSWPPIFFANITQISDFFAFPNFRKMVKFLASIERPKTKSALASRGCFALLTL